MDLNPQTEDLHEWLPIRIFRDRDDLLVDWCHMGKTRLTHPFFEDSVNAQFRRPFSLLFRRVTPIDRLDTLTSGVYPSGFIFHMSRCGSTLVTQMLSRLPKNVVLSEAPPIDSVLRVSASEAERTRWLRSLLNTYGRKRSGEEEHLFVKFDSWSTSELGLLTRAFPDVPWIFLYRDPVEVIVSHMRQPGVQMVPGLINGMNAGNEEDSGAVSSEEYCARVLATVCSSALDLTDSARGLFVNYSELPDAFSTIVGHFGVGFSPTEMEEMHAAVEFNAKTPQLFFEPDSERKKNEATEAIRQAASKWVDPLYRRLENVRLRREKVGL